MRELCKFSLTYTAAYQETVDEAKSEDSDKALIKCVAVIIRGVLELSSQESKADHSININNHHEENGYPDE